jgi:hypothetical protein
MGGHSHQFRCSILLTTIFFVASCGGGGHDSQSAGNPPPPTPTLQSITVTPDNSSVAKGRSQQFTATGTYSDGSKADVTAKSAWTSTIAAVATVDATMGLAQSVSLGTTSIAATIGTVSGSTSLTVAAPVPDHVVITPSKVGLSIGENADLRAVLVYSDTTNTDVSSRASWTSSAPSIATVNVASGHVTGNATGSATISATVDGVSNTSSVFVVTATWTSDEALSRASVNHTATLLGNGKVLVAGGEDPTSVPSRPAFRNWALFDPTAGMWSAGNSSATGARASATLLADGRVLLVGGDAGWQFQSAPEDGAFIYDPTSGMVTPTGKLITARARHTATLLPNGKVLIAGGQVATTQPGGTFANATTSAELYDPATGNSVSTGNMLHAHAGAHAFLLSNSKVLVVDSPADAELYDLATQIWSATASAPASFGSISGTTSVLLANGKVLVTGGSADAGQPTHGECELYDSGSNQWSPTGSLNIGRTGHIATVLPSGEVLVAGGVDGGGIPVSSAEIYDPVAGTWSLSASLPTPVYGHTATLLHTGQVLVLGGMGQHGTVADAQLFNP